MNSRHPITILVWLVWLAGASAWAACPERTLSIAGVTEVAGRETAMPISLVGTGNENGLSFSLNFDPARLIYLGQTLSVGASGTSLLVNTNMVSLGELGLILAKPAGQSFAAGSNELVRIRFLLLGNAATTSVSFADAPLAREVVDTYANALCANYSNAQVVMTPLVLPTILADPVSQTIQPITNIATNVTFSVTAGGSLPLRYQWRWNGANLVSASASATSLTLTNVGPAQAGNYDVVVTNDGGAVTSQVAVLTLFPALIPPAIVSSPRSQIVSTGETVYLTVAVSGSSPLSYQWQRNSSSLDQATNNVLVLTNITVAQAGSYSVVVRNIGGTATSQTATVTVSTDLRVVQVVATAVATAGTIDVPVALIGFGDESAVAFSLDFDPAALSFLGVRLGSGASGAGLLLNTNSLASGRVGIALTRQAGQTFASGTNQLVLVRFLAGDVSGPTAVAFGDQPIARELADVLANPRPVSFHDGVVNILATGASITQDPASLTAPIFSQAVFQAGVAGSTPLSFQWQWNGADLAGATDSTLTLNNVTPAMAGSYRLIVTNAAGAATSGVATLSVPCVVRAGTTNGPTGNLVELPVQLLAAGNENSVGFSLDFDPTQMTVMGVSPGSALGGGLLNYNTNRAGHVGVIVAQNNNAAFGLGTQEVARIQFLLGQQTGVNVPAWSDVPVVRELADTNANSLTVQFQPGAVGIQLVAPQITRQPVPQTVWIGDTVTFDLAVNGSKPMSWQWQRNGTDLSGATNAALTITNVQSTDGGNYSVRIGNAANTVSSGSALLTVLTARPDFFVSEVAAPAIAAPGQTVPVTWKLFNNGNADARAGWWHTLWLASDAAGDNPQFVAALPFTTPLSAGASLSVTSLVEVPSAVLGDRYFMVRADGSNDVVELNENNNMAVAAQSTRITSGDLVLTALWVPANAQMGQTITVTWVVTNAGNTAASGPWLDRLYLGSSPDSLAGALTLLTVQAPAPTLAAGAAYTNTQQVALPLQTQVSPGTYYLTALADCLNNVIESSRANNSLTVPILLTADYVISASNNPPVGGTVAGIGYYVSGATNVLTAYPAPGYSFVNWTEDGNILSTSPTLTTVVYGDHLFVANYAEANVMHVVTTATSPAGVATVTGAGVYTNGQSAIFSAPPVVVSGQYDYFLQEFVLTNTVVSTNASFVKTFLPVDPTNLQYTAVYARLGITPLVTNVTANLPNPTTATTYFQLAFRFDRTMDTNFTPQVLLTNSAPGTVQATVPAGGGWASTVLTNDTFYPPPITLTPGMDGTILVFLSGAQDPLGVTTGLTNVYAILLDATPPVLSNIAVSTVALSAQVTWTSDEPVASLVEYGVTASYGLNSGWYGQLATAHAVTLYNLIPLTTYHYRIHARDQAGNETTSDDGTFTTFGAPDLQVANLSAAGDSVSGGNLLVSWADTNSGAGATFTSWYDQVIVTNTTTGQTVWDSSLYYDAGVNGNLASGDSRNRQLAVQVPNGPAGVGNLQVIVIVNAYRNQYEANGGGNPYSNNTASSALSSALAAYPDLQITGLAVTNQQLESGSTVALVWNDANTGNDSVSNSFYDQIVVVNQTTARTLVSTALADNAAMAPIAAGQAVARQFTFVLPDGVPGTGTLQITIKADLYNQVYEYNFSGTAESNNTNSIAVVSTLAPYPDLAVTNVVVPASANAGQVIPVTWTETNLGAASATNTWYDQVFLTDASAIGGGQLLGTFAFTNGLAVNQSTNLMQTVTLPQFVQGNQWIVVKANASASFFELNTANNSGISTQAVVVMPTLLLSLSQASVSESAGTNSVLATLARNGDISAPLTAMLTTGTGTNLVVPPSVTIPAGQSAARFLTGPIDYFIAGDPMVDTVTATAPGFPTATAPLTILEDDRATLSLSLSAASVDEDAGANAIIGTVTRNANFGTPLTVSLMSDNSSALTVPANVTIPPGQAGATFGLTPVPVGGLSDTRRANVSATAPGFSSVSTKVEVLNVNSVKLSLSLLSAAVNKGAGSSADVGTVSVAAPLLGAQNVLLTVQNNSLVSMPSIVTIPAGATSVNFNISVGNDNLATGPQTATLLAQPLTPGRVALTEGQAIGTLQILDINGPTLSVSVANSTISKGSNTLVTVTRNTVPTNAVTVNLSSSPPGIVSLPATLDLPANQSSAIFTVTGILDGKQTGPEAVTLTASAADFNSGAVPLTVSDIYLADLLPTSITVASNALTSSQLTVSWVEANNGLGAATNQVWHDYVYLAGDGLGQNLSLVAIVTNTSGLPIGATYTNQASFYLPVVPGDYWVMVVADGGNVVAELNKQNNSLVSSQPVMVNPLYRAAITNVRPTVAPAGTPILLSGWTYNPTNQQPLPNELATVRVVVNGARRIYTVLSDANGNFSYTFQPLASEGGDYTVGADYPYLLQDPVQGSFALLGMQVVPASFNVQVLPNVPLTGQLVLSNLSDHPLSGLAFTVPDLQGNLTAQFSFTNNTLPGSGATTVNYSFLSPLTRNAQIRFTATATSAEGSQVSLPVTATVVPLVPQLVANPGYLASGMLVGQQTVVSFDILNTGGASSGDLTVNWPTNLTWMVLGCPATIPSIAAGGKATVTLLLNPPTDLPLTLYTGNLAAFNGNAGLSVQFQFRAVSTATGDLQVKATDDYTYYVAGEPTVTNATITVRDPFTSAVIAQTNTDANGFAYFAALPAGPYTVEGTAPKHNQFRGSIAVAPGAVASLEAFLPRQLITYQWTVVPTEIPDNYKIVLESVFETQVPVPNVVVEEPRVLLPVAPGVASQFNIKLSNQGLIAANGVKINVPNDPTYLVTPLVTDVGIIPAQSSVEVPVTVQLRSAPAPGLVKGGQVVPKDGGGCSLSDINACLPDIPLGVEYYYVCGPNNVLQQRSVDLSVICTTKKAKDCLEGFKSVATSDNLLGLGCNALSAYLACAGPDLSPCQQALISTGCGAAVGALEGGLVGAAAGGLSGGASDILQCLCTLLKDVPLPPSSPGGSTADGGGFNFGFFGGGGWTVSGGGIATGSDVGCSPSPSLATSVQNTPVPNFLAQLRTPIRPMASQGVCAHVRIRIEQSVTLTRTAFQGTLEIDDGGDTSITGIQVNLDFRDATNGAAASKFVVEGPVVSGMTAVDGTGTLAGGASGSAIYTFIPTLDAAPNAPATYQIGGTLSYMDNGEPVTVPLLSAPITVYPEARLDLAYFQQRDVYGDDPFTPQIEPSEPFALGLIVKNVGAGSAHNFQITSGQPAIVDNQKGLLINFTIIGTEVGDQPLTPSLSANLGDLAPGIAKEVTWEMLSTLQGKFISFDASFEHVNDLGSTNTSLINSVTIHELIHPVLANRSTDDDVPDFLVNDIPDPGNLPDTLYLSDGTVAAVNVVTNGAFDGQIGPGHLQTHLTTTVSNGWNYFQVPDPGPGYLLQRVVRSDGKVLALTNNAWTTDRSFPSSSTGAVYENLLHLFDWQGTGAYTLYYHSTNTAPPAIVSVGPVTPFNQTGAVSSVEIVFSEPVDMTTFSAANLALTLNGGANLIASGAAVSLTLLSNATYSINGLAPFTTADGNYQLTVNGSGIYDLWANDAGNESASTQWAKGNAAPVVQSIAAISPNPRNTPVTSLSVNFSKEIAPATFTYQALSLTRDGGPNLITSDVTITAQSANSFIVGGLGPLTGVQGNYVLAVSAAAVQDTGGIAGAGSQSIAWSMITTGPAITALEPVSTNPRNIVVRTLDVTFSEPVDPATFDYHAVTLTRDGGPNLVSSDVTVTRLTATTFRIGNFSWVQGYAGTYSFTVNAAGLADLAGNPGAGSTNEAWQIILEIPPTPAHLFIAPDLGLSSTDGLTSTNKLTLFGSVGDTNLTVRVLDVTTSTDWGTAAVNGTNFSAALSFTSEGAHHLQVTATDVAGNVSPPSFFDLFLDVIPPTAIIQQVSNPLYSAVSSITVVFSEPINTNTLSPTNFVVSFNGSIPFTPTLTYLSSNTCLLGNLTAYTAPLGTYQVALNLGGVQDFAGNQSANVITMSWVHDTTNLPPIMAAITNVVMPPDGVAVVRVKAHDPNSDELTYSLASGSPPSAYIDATNGVFEWFPTRAYAETTNSFTVVVADNGSPPMSVTQSFTVVVLDYLEVSLGHTNLQVGESASLPVYLASNDGFTNLVFAVQVPETRLTNWTLTPLAPELTSATLVDQTTNLVIALQAAAAEPLQGPKLALRLDFLAASNQPSAFVALPIISITGLKPTGSAYSNYIAHAGWVAVVQDQPLLLGAVSNQLARTLTVYGKPGTNYQVQYKSTLTAPVWQPLFDYTQTNGAVNLELDAANPMIFYRLLQQ